MSQNLDELNVEMQQKFLGGDSQNFLHKFVRFFATLDPKILRLKQLKVVFEANIIKG